MTRLLIGIDDTDFGESIGTGALARELGLHLERVARAQSHGITRHQLLVDPRIPYTSHNSAACLEVEVSAELDAIEALCCAFVGQLFHTGADPGVCLLERNGAAPAGLVELGRRAQSSVLDKGEALRVCERSGVRQRELGGDGLGVIGAAAACGLRLSGNDGRFISLPGVRELDGVLTVGDILRRSPIQCVVGDDGRPLDAAVEVDTGGWVRPDLVAGEIVLRARLREPEGRYAVVRDKHMDKH